MTSHEIRYGMRTVITFYGKEDETLGHFLTSQCFDLSTRCPNDQCKRNVLRHILSYTHNNGTPSLSKISPSMMTLTLAGAFICVPVSPLEGDGSATWK